MNPRDLRVRRQASKIRADLQLIADMIEPGARVLDIGCGDGSLLEHLVYVKQVTGRGIELSQEGVNACVSLGLSVIQGDADTDLRLLADIDHLNFRELPAGSRLGWLRDGVDRVLDVRDDNDQQVFERYFTIQDGALTSASAFMPSMFTLDERIIRQDCLGYLMERLFPE